MRTVFCNQMVEAAANPELVFLTGDLGYKALEPLRDRLGNRFINAGIAEQNMISVAAGLARSGMRVWAYSIAPFLYARPFEQIRNDLCLHKLPVVLVGNGGGYGYGVMGATHHAIEDYGALLTLQHMRAFIPAFDGDIARIIPILSRIDCPAYLRLGVSEAPGGLAPPDYAPWRLLLKGGSGGATILVIGPLAGGIVDAVRPMLSEKRPSVWLLSELPIGELPAAFLEEVRSARHLVVVEEHVAQGGAGQMLAVQLLCRGIMPRRFTHRAAKGYLSGSYGSQKFHRRECGLDPESVLAVACQT